MSKRELKKYVKELPREELEDQIVDLYERFPEVRTFYKFVFRPNEKQLLEEARTKISLESFKQ